MVKCLLTNYGDIPIFDVSFEIEVFWREVIPTENGTKSGSVVSSAKYKSPQFRIGVSPNNEEHFYIMNLSQSYVFIPMPTVASARNATSESTNITKIIQSASALPGMFFQPKVVTNPPAASPPSPASPAEK
jgi:hypothetical protein